MFIVFFTFFCVVGLWTYSIFRILISLLVVLLLFWIIYCFSKVSLQKISKRALFVFMAGALSVLSLLMFDLRSNNGGFTSFYIGTGTIQNDLWWWKYALRIDDWTQYVYYTKQSHRLGDTIITYSTLKYYPTKSMSFRGTSSIMTGFDYPQRLKMKGYGGVMFEWQRVVVSRNDYSVASIKQMVFDEIDKNFAQQRQKWLIRWMLVWDTSLISKTDYQNFVNSGLVHLVAVSGGNVVIVVMFLTWIFCRLPFYIRLVAIVLGVWCYATVCWRDSSIMRATIMSTLSMVCLFMGKPTLTWRVLGFTYLLMLCRNPYFLRYDRGFVLSFSAVCWILLLSNNKSVWLKKYVVDLVLPTLGASVGVMPRLLFFSSTFNLTSILCNLVLVPLVPIITVGGLLVVILSIFWISVSLLVIPLSWLIDLVYRFSYVFSHWWVFVDVVEWPLKVVLPVFFLVGLFTYVIKNKF